MSPEPIDDATLYALAYANALAQIHAAEMVVQGRPYQDRVDHRHRLPADTIGLEAVAQRHRIRGSVLAGKQSDKEPTP